MSEVKCRILCVDDHEDTAEMLKLLLSESDYVVHPAHNIEEAMELARTHEFDLYVLDKRLPDGTGMDLCAMLNSLTPGVPCIFYVPKPDVEALIEAVHRLLSERECAEA
jgi:DNA-binding NtrC family response regulator